MTAKFDGKCRDCGARIFAGDKIRWSKATGAMCATESDCDEMFAMRQEQEAEMAMESFAEARLMGMASSWHENYYG